MMIREHVHPLLRGFSLVCLGVWSVCVIYPLLWTLFGALKNNEQFYLGKPWDLPEWPPFWSNFGYVWKEFHFQHYFWNSAFVTLASTFLALLLSATTAYVLARFVFRGSALLYYVYIASMMIPMILGLIPLFFLLDDLRMINSLWGLVAVYTANALPFGIFVLIGFFKILPKEAEESAFMDGASYYRTFLSIMLPLSRSGLVTVAIMNVLNIWNEYLLGTVIVNDPGKYTLPVGIAVMQAEMQYRTEWGPLFSGLLMSVLPVVVFYFLFQRQISKGITVGAVK